MFEPPSPCSSQKNNMNNDKKIWKFTNKKFPTIISKDISFLVIHTTEKVRDEGVVEMACIQYFT